MGDRTDQQGTQVFYDPDMGQYYTNTNKNNPLGFYPPAAQLFGGMFPDMGRTYINGMNRQSPAMQNMSPYQYADVSLESLFPSMNQGSGNSALAGLLSGTPSATGSASSGAGRFM